MRYLGIEELFSLVIGTVETINCGLAVLIRYSYAIGYIILQYLQVLFFNCVWYFDKLTFAFRIVWNDFLIFLVDVDDRLMFVKVEFENAILLLHHSILLCLSGIFDVTFAFSQTILSVSLVAYDYIYWVSRTLLRIPEEIKHCIIICGKSVWLSLLLIPKGVNKLCCVSIDILQESYTQIISSVKIFLQEILCVIDKAIHFWCDVPIESSIGLLIAASAIVYTIKYRHILVQSIVTSITIILKKSIRFILHSLETIKCFARHLIRMVSWFLEFIWTGTEYMLLRSFAILTNQEQHPPPTEDILPENQPDEDDEAVKVTRQLHRRLLEEQESKLCIVCQDKGRCIILLPCKHLCLCLDCFDAIRQQHGSCPVCRQRITRKMHVYL